MFCQHDYKVQYHGGYSSYLSRQIPCATGTTDYNPINGITERVQHTIGNGDGSHINTYRKCCKCLRKICTPCYREL